jgi:hypothetical protein
MNKIILILTVSLVGCYGSQINQIQRENALLREQIGLLLSNSEKKNDIAINESSPTISRATDSPSNRKPEKVTIATTGAMIARGQPKVYLGTVGAQPRQVTMGRKIRLDNFVCDRKSRDVWSNCLDMDRNGSPDHNTYLSFEIDGQPVVCDSGFDHPQTHQALLGPTQTCFVELGRMSIVHLKIMAYRNFGTPTAVMLDAAPDFSSSKTVDVGVMTNIGKYTVDEYTF